MNYKTEQQLSIADNIIALVDKILREGDDFYTCDAALDKLAGIFGELTQISVFDDENSSRNTLLKEGNAISPVQAAKCLRQSIRTRQFWLAILAAIENQLTEHGEIRILYAGTGPYGTILLPLLPFIKQQSIRLVCIDIHEENIVAINRIIAVLQPELKQLDLICADATKWQPEPGQSFDLIISETMNAYLHREPQVSIFAHLEQFLTTTGHLIPQKIIVEAWLSDHRHYDVKEREVKVHSASKLQQLVCLDRELSRTIRQQHSEYLTAELQLPKHKLFLRSLELRTDITIFKEITLTLNQCSLNSPKHITLHGGFMSGDKVQFKYRIFNNPNWEVHRNSTYWEQPLAVSEEVGRTGIVHLKRFWDKTTRMVLNKESSKYQQEILKDLALMQLMTIPFAVAVELIAECLPDFEEFEYLLEDKLGIITTEKAELINKEWLILAQAAE